MTTPPRWRIALASAASAAMLIAAPLMGAQAASAQPYPPPPAPVTLSAYTITAGTSVTITATRVFDPEKEVTVYLESEPIVLAEYYADGTGSVQGTVTIPKQIDSGYHVLRLSQENPGRSIGVTIVVRGGLGAPPPTTTPPTTTPPTTTPPTQTPPPTKTPTHRPTHSGKPHRPSNHNGHGGHGRSVEELNADASQVDAREVSDASTHQQHRSGLAQTGSNVKTLALSGTAAGLLITGSGAMLVARRRRRS